MVRPELPDKLTLTVNTEESSIDSHSEVESNSAKLLPMFSLILFNR